MRNRKSWQGVCFLNVREEDMNHTKLIISTICIVVIFCVGCATAEPASTATDVPPTATPIPPTDTPIPRTDTPVPPTETPPEPPLEFPSGVFNNSSFDYFLIINEDGKWRLEEGPRLFFTGRYQVVGDQVIFTEWSGICTEFGDGIYTWDYSEGVLYIKTVKDDCELRRLRLIPPFTQQ
jgi:hypothetical protein